MKTEKRVKNQKTKKEQEKCVLSENQSIDFTMSHGCNTSISDSTIWLGSTSVDSDGNETGIDASMYEKFSKNLHNLEKMKKPITIKLSSPGGDTYYSLAICDEIMMCPLPVTIIGSGPIMSGASLIMQAGDNRVLTPNAQFMIHNGGDTFSGNHDDYINDAKHSKDLRKRLRDIYCKRTGLSSQKIIAMLKKDSYMSAEEAVEKGFADLVLPYVKRFS